jgi:hypothetical protein
MSLETFAWMPRAPSWSQRILPVSAVVAVLNIGLCFMQATFNAAGQIGSTRVLADRAIGKLRDTWEGYR